MKVRDRLVHFFLRFVNAHDMAPHFAARLQQNHPERAPFYDLFLQHGFHLMRDHFYHPQPSADDVAGGYWDRISELPGVDIDAQAALALADRLSPYFTEFRALFPLRDQGDGRLPLINGSYMAADGHMYYALIRYLKPKRIIEIGGGSSTVMALEALDKNRQENFNCMYRVVDPYPSQAVKLAIDGKGTLIEEKLQNIQIETFYELEENDILFIDSSHVLRSGNDVHYEYMEIIPRLKKNVYVHIHDISLPEEYPHVYYDAQLYWNEQYLLQAFLTFNNKFKVIWPGNFLMVHFPEKMHALFPEIKEMRQEYPLSEPTAFWMTA